MNRLRPLAALTLALALTPLPAAAQTVTGTDALTLWNLIVLGDLTSTSEVEGRTFVGGNLDGPASNYQIRTPAPTGHSFPGLTVIGNVTGDRKTLENGAGALIGGDVTSGFNLNGPRQTVRVGGTISNTNVNDNIVQSGLAATPGFMAALTGQKAALTDSLFALSSAYAGLTATGTATIASGRATFDAVAGANGVAVFNLTAADLGRFGEIQFNRNGASTVIVNVAGTGIDLDDNFLGSADGLGETVLWNFADATVLSLSTAWRGSVLAPHAAGSTTNYIQGSAVFGSLTQNGEIHLGTFRSGFNPVTAVPEPASWAMMIVGTGLIGGTVRRRRSRTLAAA